METGIAQLSSYFSRYVLCLFSDPSAVITAQRSLDLQCTNEIARDVWAAGLQRVLALWKEDRLNAFSKLSFT